MPLVSVFILSYNQALYLKKRINSVISQTFTDFELTIWDDASTDHSKEIIEQYRKHPYIKEIIYNPVNSGGVYTQWKKAIDHATGKYLWIAEADDFAEPDFLRRTVSILEKNEDTVLVETDSWYLVQDRPASKISANNNISFPTPLWNEDFNMNGKEFFLKALCYGNCIANVSAVVFRLSTLKQAQMPIENFSYAGDWALYIELSKKGSVAFINEVLSNMRLHHTNVSKQGLASGKSFKENFVIIKRSVQYLKELGEYHPGYIKKVNRYISIFNVPLQAKFLLLYQYFKTDFKLAITGLYYNFKNRF